MLRSFPITLVAIVLYSPVTSQIAVYGQCKDKTASGWRDSIPQPDTTVIHGHTIACLTPEYTHSTSGACNVAMSFL